MKKKFIATPNKRNYVLPPLSAIPACPFKTQVVRIVNRVLATMTANAMGDFESVPIGIYKNKVIGVANLAHDGIVIKMSK